MDVVAEASAPLYIKRNEDFFVVVTLEPFLYCKNEEGKEKNKDKKFLLDVYP